MIVVNITVYYRHKKTGEHESLTEPVRSQAIRAIKVQTGKMIKRIAKKALYYYVVVGAKKPNGETGYRTIIPKTVL